MKTTEDKDARFWDRFARRYAAASISDPAGYERTLEQMTGLIAGLSSVLEIGCGTGTTALRLASSAGNILATDISPNMIAIAQQKASAQNCTNVEFAVATPETLVATGQTFDAVLALNMLHLVRDRTATLAQVRGLLRPGGLFISKTPCLAELSPFIRAAIPLARIAGFAPHTETFSGAALERAIAAAGFDIAEAARHGSGKRDIRLVVIARRGRE